MPDARTAAFVVIFAVAAPAGAQHASQAILGLDALVDRLGVAPDGSGVKVAQIEAMSGGTYGPDPTHRDLDDKSYTALSGEPGVSSHATSVGRYWYGTSWSIAPGVENIALFHAEDWVLGGQLHGGAPGSLRPEPTPAGVKLLNNSWVGSFSSTSADNDVLRRADYVAARDDVLIVSGVNNGSGENISLMSHMFNGISVGVRDGDHVTDDTLPGIDGPGRMKPDIVGPAAFTSFASPMVAAAAAVLVETARTPPLASNPNAERPLVLRAALLAGAVHEDEHGTAWTNEAETSGPFRGITMRPIDATVGAGTVNVDRSHRVLTGAEHDGALAPPDAPNVPWAGWDLANVALGGRAHYRFALPQDAAEISVVASWNRAVPPPFTGYKLADFDLFLWRVGDDGALESLTGDDGLPHFGGGNVVSASVVDNVEHLFITGLAAGEYVVELARVDELSGYPTWPAALAWLLPESIERPEDVDGDGVVGFTDLLSVMAYWGPCDGCPEDIDGDGMVGFTDLLAVISGWD